MAPHYDTLDAHWRPRSLVAPQRTPAGASLAAPRPSCHETLGLAPRPVNYVALSLASRRLPAARVAKRARQMALQSAAKTTLCWTPLRTGTGGLFLGLEGACGPAGYAAERDRVSLGATDWRDAAQVGRQSARREHKQRRQSVLGGRLVSSGRVGGRAVPLWRRLASGREAQWEGAGEKGQEWCLAAVDEDEQCLEAAGWPAACRQLAGKRAPADSPPSTPVRNQEALIAGHCKGTCKAHEIAFSFHPKGRKVLQQLEEAHKQMTGPTGLLSFECGQVDANLWPPLTLWARHFGPAEVQREGALSRGGSTPETSTSPSWLVAGLISCRQTSRQQGGGRRERRHLLLWLNLPSTSADGLNLPHFHTVSSRRPHARDTHTDARTERQGRTEKTD